MTIVFTLFLICFIIAMLLLCLWIALKIYFDDRTDNNYDNEPHYNDVDFDCGDN